MSVQKYDYQRVSGIYEIRCKSTSRVYVGSAVNIGRRWKAHHSYLSRGIHENEYLQRAWNKYGENDFEFSLLEKVDNIQLLIETEQKWIDDKRSHIRDMGFNIEAIAGSALGVKHTLETRMKVSAAMRGRIVTEETREKLRSKRHTPEARAKMGVAKKGNKARLGHRSTQEHKDRIGLAHSGYFIAIDPNGNVYPVHGLNKFCREYGLQVSCMHAVANGKRMQHKGWKCFYASEEDRYGLQYLSEIGSSNADR